MSHPQRNQFQLTILAVAVLSLSACSTAPHTGGDIFSQVGSGIGKVGNKTVELGSNAWEGTKNLLNIGNQDDELMDEVDLALMDDDVVIQEVQIGTAELQPVVPKTALEPVLAAASKSKPLAFGEVPQQSAAEDIVVLGANDLEQPNAVSAEVLVASEGSGTVQLLDLTHEVTENETLWDIAKSTTGDATNWHILADINNLAPNASVYPGQKLTIPADMVKPEYSGVDSPVISDVAEAKLEAPATTADTRQKLILPAPTVKAEAPAVLPVPTTVAQTTVEQPVLPSTESAAVALDIPKVETKVVVAAAEQATPTTPAEPANVVDISTDAMALKVGAGETLWDFAKRTTGDATNWKVIADKNMFGEEQLGRIRPGQKIYVPADILRARDENGTLIAKGEESLAANANMGGVAPKTAVKNEEAIEATAAVLAGTNKPAAALAEEDIKIVEAKFQQAQPATPVTAESLAEEASVAVATNDKKMGKVMVKGTYYPKAVYNNADFSSSLLMRVSPGTQLLVSKAIGPWLEVRTAKGVGYVHSRDIK